MVITVHQETNLASTHTTKPLSFSTGNNTQVQVVPGATLLALDHLVCKTFGHPTETVDPDRELQPCLASILPPCSPCWEWGKYPHLKACMHVFPHHLLVEKKSTGMSTCSQHRHKSQRKQTTISRSRLSLALPVSVSIKQIKMVRQCVERKCASHTCT